MNDLLDPMSKVEPSNDKKTIKRLRAIIEQYDKSESEETDNEMLLVLQDLLDRDVTITASEVARQHPSIKATSSITRSMHRSKLLAHFKNRQIELRGWQKRASKTSNEKLARSLAEKETEITQLKQKISILTASHVGMIRAIGELGGFQQWAKFFEKYKTIRDKLSALGAMPQADIKAFSVSRKQD